MKNLNTLNLVRAGLFMIIMAFLTVAYFVAYNIEGYIMCLIPIIVFTAIAVVIKEEKLPTRLKTRNTTEVEMRDGSKLYIDFDEVGKRKLWATPSIGPNVTPTTDAEMAALKALKQE